MRLSVCQPLLVFFQLSSLHREDKDREGGGGTSQDDRLNVITKRQKYFLKFQIEYFDKIKKGENNKI